MSEKIVELYIPQKDDDLETLIRKMELLNVRLEKEKNTKNPQKIH